MIPDTTIRGRTESHMWSGTEHRKFRDTSALRIRGCTRSWRSRVRKSAWSRESADHTLASGVLAPSEHVPSSKAGHHVAGRLACEVQRQLLKRGLLMEEALLPGPGPGSGSGSGSDQGVLIELGASTALLVSHPATQPKERELEVLAISIESACSSCSHCLAISV